MLNSTFRVSVRVVEGVREPLQQGGRDFDGPVPSWNMDKPDGRHRARQTAAPLRAAAEAAIAGGEECITPAVLARSMYRGPGERRDAVERELA